ncbi:MAG: hypothetical protein HYS39_00530 [Proteobacteria bacterium]|nr:hypothetical protein [Pseudomonadota bacterium]
MKKRIIAFLLLTSCEPLPGEKDINYQALPPDLTEFPSKPSVPDMLPVRQQLEQEKKDIQSQYVSSSH